MGISRVTRNCQVTLPKDVRELAGIKEGDDVFFNIEKGKIFLQRADKDPIMAAAGIWKGLKETGVQYQKRVRGEWKKRQQKIDW